MPNILRSKVNQTIKVGSLMKYRMRKTFLEKSCTKRWGELVPDPFPKNQKWAYFWINSLKFYTVCFYFISKSRTTKIYRAEIADRKLLLHIKLFLTNKKRFETSFPAPFSAWFWKINFSHLLFSNQIWLPYCLYFLRYWERILEKYVPCNYLYPSLWRHKFWN